MISMLRIMANWIARRFGMEEGLSVEERLDHRLRLKGEEVPWLWMTRADGVRYMARDINRGRWRDAIEEIDREIDRRSGLNPEGGMADVATLIWKTRDHQ